MRGTFMDWISNRALRLSLCGWVKACDPGVIEIYLSGDRVLVEAMEVACTLGPVDALVDKIKMEDVPAPVYRQTDGFVRHSGNRLAGMDTIE